MKNAQVSQATETQRTHIAQYARLLLLTMAVAIAVISCSGTHKNAQGGEQQKSTVNALAVQDTTPKVTGVGGVFFFADNPKETRTWYSQNLGMDIGDYGASFETRDLNNPQEINTLQWTTFKTGNPYFAPSKKEFMINYTVQNIEGLVRKLQANGVTVLDTIETYDYGKFVHIMDLEGNKIQLWEPVREIRTVGEPKK